MMIRTSLGALALAISTIASAQFCTVGPTTATLRVEGLVPSVAAPGTHTVTLTGSNLELSITDGGSLRPFILLYNAAGVTPFGFGVPLGCGALDLSGPAVLMDGIFLAAGPFDVFALTDFSVSIPTGATPCSVYNGPGFQAIYLDPTLPGLPYGFTEAGSAASAGPITTVYPAVGDDTFVTHTLACGGVTFAGTVYTQLQIGSNANISFLTGSGDFSPTNAEFFAGFRAGAPTTANPGVAAQWGDYFRSTNTLDNITVVDSSTSVQVQYNNMGHWDSGAPAGSWSVTFNAADDVVIDLTGYTVGTAADFARITGVTNGLPAPGTTQTVLDLSANIGYTSPGGAESIMESYPTGGGDAGASYNFIHLGGFTWLLL